MSRAGIAAREDAPAGEILRWALGEFGDRVALVTAFQAEGMVLLDMAHRISPEIRVITVDSGRLPQETFTLIDMVRARYGITVDVRLPDARLVERMVARHGVNLFYQDALLRRLCCEVRKVFPLDAALRGLDAWITGLRRTQSNARAQTPKVQIEDARGLVKVSPLADWEAGQVWDYIAAHEVPVHPLYAQGYRSIGCAPCTRASGDDEPERAGRWWWERDEKKECGIHDQTPDDRLREELTWLSSQT